MVVRAATVAQELDEVERDGFEELEAPRRAPERGHQPRRTGELEQWLPVRTVREPGDGDCSAVRGAEDGRQRPQPGGHRHEARARASASCRLTRYSSLSGSDLSARP